MVPKPRAPPRVPRTGHPGRPTLSNARRTLRCWRVTSTAPGELYTRAIAKDSGDWELWLGLALASRGDARRQAFQRAAALNPLGTEIQQLGNQLGVRNSP